VKILTLLCLPLLSPLSHANDDIPARVRGAPVILAGKYACYAVESRHLYCRYCEKCEPMPVTVVKFIERDRRI
jgi:hypothetical protein